MLSKMKLSKAVKFLITLVLTSLILVFFIFTEKTASKEEDSIQETVDVVIEEPVYSMDYLVNEIFYTDSNRGYLRTSSGFKSKPETISTELSKNFEGDLLECETYYDIEELLQVLYSKQVLSYSYENVTNDEVVSLVIYLAEEGFNLMEYSNVNGKLLIKMNIEDKIVTVYYYLQNLEIMGNTNIF